MKNISRSTTAMLLSIVCFFISCKKDILPYGEQYSNAILSGNIIPSDSIGNTGDFYINLSSSDLYGPKNDTTGWGFPISLKGLSGTNGTNGIDGNSILSDNGVPAASLGKDGDFYINTNTADLYGPKTSGSWGTATNLKGLKGDKGDPGTANVIYSNWFTPSTWAKDTVFGVWGFNYSVVEPKITQDILDKGAVIVYGKLNGYVASVWPNNQVSQMPISITYNAGTIMTDTWTGIGSLGAVKIRFVNNQNFYAAISTSSSFRYVIIPGGVAVTSSINIKDYNAVKKAFNLKD